MESHRHHGVGAAVIKISKFSAADLQTVGAAKMTATTDARQGQMQMRATTHNGDLQPPQAQQNEQQSYLLDSFKQAQASVCAALPQEQRRCTCPDAFDVVEREERSTHSSKNFSTMRE